MDPAPPTDRLPRGRKRPKVKGNRHPSRLLPPFPTCMHPMPLVLPFSADPSTLSPGCYECSRRRIDCDRRGPVCLKCERRGLECSGLGVRYRFNDGVASRGKLAGKKVPEGALSYVRDRVSRGSRPRDTPPPCPLGNGGKNADSVAGEEEEGDAGAMGLSSCLQLAAGPDHLDGATRYLLHYCEWMP